jgi:hypothetical protein
MKMKDKNLFKNRKRLGEIEDRKIEILLEIGRINNEFDEKLSGLYSEYERLDKEYYKIKLLPFKNGSIL